MKQPSTKDKKALWDLCQKFVQDNDIGGAETIYQCDNVVLNALPFIEKISELVGYKEFSEEEE